MIPICFFDNGFSVDLSGAAVVKCPKSPNKEISYLNIGGGTAKIDGVDVIDKEYGGWGKTSLNVDSFKDFVDPIIVDGTSSDVKIITLR